MADPKLFEATFVIKGPRDRKYENVTRWAMESMPENSGPGDSSAPIQFEIDIADRLFGVGEGDEVTVTLASTLKLDGSKMDKGWREELPGEVNLAKSYDYVCTGTVYHFSEESRDNIRAIASFGGLLCDMKGPYKKLTPLRVQEVYLLMKNHTRPQLDQHQQR